eukprot:scaffold229648_cov26-Tisochrysis_lutea.AAC.1
MSLNFACSTRLRAFDCRSPGLLLLDELFNIRRLETKLCRLRDGGTNRLELTGFLSYLPRSFAQEPCIVLTGLPPTQLPLDLSSCPRFRGCRSQSRSSLVSPRLGLSLALLSTAGERRHDQLAALREIRQLVSINDAAFEQVIQLVHDIDELDALALLPRALQLTPDRLDVSLTLRRAVSVSQRALFAVGKELSGSRMCVLFRKSRGHSLVDQDNESPHSRSAQRNRRISRAATPCVRRRFDVSTRGL